MLITYKLALVGCVEIQEGISRVKKNIQCRKENMKEFPTYDQWLRLKNKVTESGNIMCPDCEGTGKAYDWADRDPIEGWKMASKKTCQTCKGHGVLSYYEFGHDYIKEQDKFYRDLEKENMLRDRRREIQNKLTLEDIEFIRDYGLEG